MFGLLSRAPRQFAPVRPSFRPILERLEERDCPSTIAFMGITNSANKLVNFLGRVTNAPILGGLTVQLSGVATGTATTDSNGNFQVTLSATSLGTVSAATTDGLSSTAETTLTDVNAPQISQFYSMSFQGGYYEFSGHVNGTVLPGETITFGGMIGCVDGQTATVNSNGDFFVCEKLAPSDGGSVNATTSADAWGVTSTASTWVSQA